MSNSPFPITPELAARWGGLVEAKGDVFLARLGMRLYAGGADPVHPVSVIPAAVVAELIGSVGLADATDAAVLALAAAAALARPHISSHRVGVVGMGAASGDLYLGGNLEFPGASIWHTVHAEGFAALLARARGDRLGVLVSTQARPCAHCRQVLAEFDGAFEMRLIDPLGHDLRLGDVFPWPFTPGDLGQGGATDDAGEAPALEAPRSLPEGVAETLAAVGLRAHAPYSGSRAAIVLRLGDGTLVGGAVLESVAFNPTVGPLQDALVGLVAAGRRYDEIADAWLAVGRAAPINHETPTRDLLATVADAPLQTTYWG
jgi:cytidine deaminase